MASKSSASLTSLTSVADFIGIGEDELEEVFVCEDWSGDLATGILWVGPQTAAFHGLSGNSCGIMDIIQPYDRADWQRILLALEEVATIETDFSFSTTIRPGPELHRPVFCFGRSEMRSTGGVVIGTFAIARLCLDATHGKPVKLN